MWCSVPVLETRRQSNKQLILKEKKEISGFNTYPFLSIEYKLREAKGSCTSLGWMVVDHVIVQEGKFKKIFCKCVFLSISLKTKQTKLQDSLTKSTFNILLRQ